MAGPARTTMRSDTSTGKSERKIEPEEDPVAPGAEWMRPAGGEVDTVAEREGEQRRDGHPREVVALEDVPAELQVQDLRLARARLEDDVALVAAGLHPVVADRRQQAVRQAVVGLRRQPLRVAHEAADHPVGDVAGLSARQGPLEGT